MTLSVFVNWNVMYVTSPMVMVSRVYEMPVRFSARPVSASIHPTKW